MDIRDVAVCLRGTLIAVGFLFVGVWIASEPIAPEPLLSGVSVRAAFDETQGFEPLVLTDRVRDGDEVTKWRGERPDICLMDRCPESAARPTICEMRSLPESDVCDRQPLRIRDLDVTSSAAPFPDWND